MTNEARTPGDQRRQLTSLTRKEKKKTATMTILL